MLRHARWFLLVAVVACDLPTDPATARDRLGTEPRTISLTIPAPLVRVSLQEQLARPDLVGTLLDTASFTLRVPRFSSAFALAANLPAALPITTPVPFGFDNEQAFTGIGIDAEASLLRDVELAGVELQARIANGSGASVLVDSIMLATAREHGPNVRLRLPGGRLGPHESLPVNVPASEFATALLARAASGATPRVQMHVDGRFENGRLARGDDLRLDVDMKVPLRFRLPAQGIPVERRMHMVIDSAIAGSADVVKSGSITLEITNSTGLAAKVTVAVAATPQDTVGFDPRTASHAIHVTPFQVSARGTSRQVIDIPVEKLDELKAGRVTVALLVNLTSGNTAVALERTDEVSVATTVRLAISSGSGGGK